MAENLDQQTADVLRRQQRVARADRSFNVAKNTSNIRPAENRTISERNYSKIPKSNNRNNQRFTNSLRLYPEKKDKTGDDTRSVLGSLRHKVRQSAPSGVASAEKALVSTLSSPIRTATGGALKQSWINIIDSFGLTLLYINIHVFGRLIVGNDFFCKLGHEWVPKTGNSKSVQKTAQANGDRIGLVETLLLLLLDLVALMLVIGVFVILVLIVYAIVYPIDTIGKILGIT